MLLYIFFFKLKINLKKRKLFTCQVFGLWHYFFFNFLYFTDLKICNNELIKNIIISVFIMVLILVKYETQNESYSMTQQQQEQQQELMQLRTTWISYSRKFRWRDSLSSEKAKNSKKQLQTKRNFKTREIMLLIQIPGNSEPRKKGRNFCKKELETKLC